MINTYTNKEANTLGQRNDIYNRMRHAGLHETADMFWTAWHLYYKPEGKYCSIVKRILGL